MKKKQRPEFLRPVYSELAKRTKKNENMYFSAAEKGYQAKKLP